jgi:hypothetical protein
MRILNVIRVRDGIPVDVYNFVDDMDAAVDMFATLSKESGQPFDNGLALEAAIDRGYIETMDGSVCFNVDSCPQVKKS